jgi:hypothetical protein
MSRNDSVGGGSVISATDLELFKNLANPAKVDFKQNPKNNGPAPNIPPTTINGESRRSHSRSRSRSTSRSASRSRSNSKHSPNNRASSPLNKPSFSPSLRQRREPQSPKSTSPIASPPRRSFKRSHRPSPRDRKNRLNSSSHSRSRTKSRSRSRSRSRDSDRKKSTPTNINPFRQNPPPPPVRHTSDYNPFKNSNHIPAFFHANQPDSYNNHTSPTSAFDKETQKFLHNEPLSPVKLPHDGVRMKPFKAGIHPTFFSPTKVQNPLDNFSPTTSPVRKHKKSHKHHKHRHSSIRSPSSRHRSRSRSHSKRRDAGEEDEITRQEKRKYILQLEKLRLQGARLTKDYTMEDSLADIRFEYDSHQSNYDVVDSVNFMKEILGVSFTTIEALNQRFGPILQLKGWSEYMQKNMSRFDRVLERAYHRFWRHGQPSPVMEFGWLVFGSMLMWHLQNKYLGGLNVGDMFGVMPGNNSSPTVTNTAATVPMNNGNNGNNNGGGGFSLGGIGNILRMFTGGNANRPQPNPSSNMNHPPRNLPVIIPPVPSSSSFSNNRSSQQQPPPPQQLPSNDSRPNSQRTRPNNNDFRPPVSLNPVPSTTTVASLPPMNIKGISSDVSAGSNVRRSLRRPSAHLRETENNFPGPLSPVIESNQENDIPSPP